MDGMIVRFSLSSTQPLRRLRNFPLRTATGTLLAVAVAGLGALAAEPIDLANAAIGARFDPASGQLTITGRQAGPGTLNIRPFAGEARAVVEGRQLRVRPTAGPDELVIEVPEDGPFVKIHTVHQANQPGTNLRTDRLFDATLDLGQPAAALRVLGTAGLTKVDGHPGSHVFLAVVDPASRRGLVAGFLTLKKADGILFSGLDGGTVTFAAQNDYGRYLLPAGQRVAGETLALGFFADARLGLEQWATATAAANQIKLKPRMNGYCTWYSQPHGGASDEKNIVELTKFAAAQLQPFGFNYVQIDDMWQDGARRKGPAKVFERVNPKGPYPSGMKAAADGIRAAGLTAGIWYMPFAGDQEDPWFKDKQHWFAKQADGSVYFTAWGGGALDLTHPEVQQYVHRIARLTTREWGYRFLKLDGMWTGLANAQLYVANGYRPDDLGAATVHNPQLTPFEAYHQAFRQLRDGAGPDTYILGCCASQNMRSLGAAIGNVDAMRIGPDNGPDWDSLQRGPWHGSNRYFFNGRIWHNDPDPVYVRASVPLPHARAICSWVALTGTLHASSEWLPGLPAERLDLLRRSLPAHDFPARPADLFETDLARVWHVADPRRPDRCVVGLFQWDPAAPGVISRPAAQLDLPPGETWVGYEYWSNTLVAPFRDRLETTVPAASCKVISLVAARPHPQVLGTSRHLTQGLMDLHDDQWDAATATLAGRSDVVANDRYELRILATDGAFARATAVELDDAARQAGATAVISQRGPLVRLTVRSPQSRSVKWSLKFAAAEAGSAAPAVAGLHAAAVTFGTVSLAWQPSDHLWMVRRDGGPAVVVDQASFTDEAPEPGREHVYQVSVYPGRAGGPAASVKVTTPAEPTPGPVPPAPEVLLTTLTPATATTGWGKLATDRSVGNKPLTIGGKRFARGLGTHAPSVIRYPLKPEYRRFVAIAGLDDGQRHEQDGSVVFRVRIVKEDRSVSESARSPVLTWRKEGRWHFDVPIPTGATAIELVVDDAGDGIRCDHADWAEAGFMTTDQGS
jgi:hypothetical protein